MQLIAMLLMLLGLPFAAASLGWTSWGCLAIGAAAWGGGLVVKVVAGLPIGLATKLLGNRAGLRSGVWGAWSAAAELGATWLAVWWLDVEPSLQSAIGLGLGAGCVEVGFVLLCALGEAPPKSGGVPGEEPSPPKLDPFVAWSAVMERAWSVLGHFSTRAMLLVSLSASTVIPAAVGFATFALVDGVATFGADRGWDWTDPRTCRRFHAFLGSVAVVEILLFGFFAWRHGFF